jgi:type I restriction enzyme R subunit
VQDWYKDSQSRIIVKAEIEEVLNSELPETYDKKLFKEKSGKMFDLVFEYSSKGARWTA